MRPRWRRVVQRYAGNDHRIVAGLLDAGLTHSNLSAEPYDMKPPMRSPAALLWPRLLAALLVSLMAAVKCHAEEAEA